jgi:hypothetical protein
MIPNEWMKKDEKIKENCLEKISLLKSSRFVLEMLLEQEKKKTQIERKVCKTRRFPMFTRQTKYVEEEIEIHYPIDIASDAAAQLMFRRSRIFYFQLTACCSKTQKS